MQVLNKTFRTSCKSVVLSLGARNRVRGQTANHDSLQDDFKRRKIGGKKTLILSFSDFDISINDSRDEVLLCLTVIHNNTATV